jgi:hypothetical protein
MFGLKLFGFYVAGINHVGVEEWEHEANDREALNDCATMVSLRNCVLKFFMCPSLRAQRLLL